MSELEIAAAETPEAGTPSLHAFACDEESRNLIKEIAGELPVGSVAVQSGGIRAAIDHLAVNRSPKLLLVDLSGSELPLNDVDELADVCEPGVLVIALGDQNDVGLFRELTLRGVADYLVKPLNPPLLRESLLRVIQGIGRQSQMSRLGRLVSVVGARGGVGSTCIACGLAHLIAGRRRRRTLLLDLDLQMGSAALTFDLDPVHGLREALEQPERIDTLFVDRACARRSDTLYVLSAEEPLEDEILVHPDATETLLGELRNRFHFTIVDLPRPPSPLFLQCLEQSNQLVIVADPTLASMRDTLRILQLVSKINASCQPMVVLNRVEANRTGELERKEFEHGIGRKVDLLIGFDNRLVTASLNAGQLDFAEKGKLAQGLGQLLELTVRGPSNPHRSLVRRLLALWSS